jgi:hypothetical protein
MFHFKISFQYNTLVLALIMLSFFVKVTGAVGQNTRTNAKKQQESIKPDESIKNKKISSQVITSINNTWGYDILVENKIFIHQPSIPGVNGNEGFKSKLAAQNVANLVITKMKKGEMPPSVTEEEMKKLNVLN